MQTVKGGVVEYWKRVLKLNDWDVKVKLCHVSDLESGNSQGQIKYNFIGKQALIYLLNPDDWDNNYFEQDITVVFVHELLHLKFDIVKTKNGYAKFQHQLLEDMAKTMVGIDRKYNFNFESIVEVIE